MSARSELPVDEPPPNGSSLGEWPVPPLGIEGEDRSSGIPVTVEPLAGDAYAAELLGHYGSAGRLSLRRDGKSATVDSSSVRLLTAAGQLRLGELPRGDKRRLVPLELEFVDGERRRLDTLGHVRTSFALHVFCPDEHLPEGVVRIVIPHSSLARARLGTPIGRILVEDGHVSESSVEQALEQQASDASGTRVRLGELLRAQGDVRDADLQQSLARQLGIQCIDLEETEIDPRVVSLVPAALARELCVLPYQAQGGHLRVAMQNPTDYDALQTLQFVTGMAIEVATAESEALQAHVRQFYPDPDVEMVEEVARSFAEEAPLPAIALEKSGRDRPIVRLVDKLIGDAVTQRASDIHIRPGDRNFEILYRVDGVLQLVWTLSKAVLRAIVARIKILGDIDISEHRVPQDGRTAIVIGGRRLDLRISIIPAVNGDSVVLRLLDGAQALLSIDQLGLPERDERSFLEILGRGHGMLLATGPTGSGKSTTLYAALREIRATGVNIITIENPVEYHIEGITQIQVNLDTGMTFARALRNILRHDPDVIMIGEIRDEESARIAVESAMTGHLVLSTLHTNSAAGSVSRLLEMGIPAYLLNSSLSGCLAQRLVRRNCPHCLVEAKVDPRLESMLGIEPGESFWEGQGCEHCSGNGYRGRVGVYELLVLSDRVRETLLADGTAVEQVAVEEGMTLLLENAMRQARAGVISLREVFRIRGD